MNKKITIMSAIAATAAVIAAIIFVVLPQNSKANNISNNINIKAASLTYCTQGTYGYNIRVSRTSYAPGETVNFCMRDDTRIPLFLREGERPWKITDSLGRTIFEPATTQIGTATPVTNNIFYDSWNQRDNNGTQVTSGTYMISFPGYLASPVSFIVSNTIPSDNQTKNSSNNQNDNQNNVSKNAPYLLLSTYKGRPGDAVMVSGYNFSPYENILVQFREAAGANDSNAIVIRADRNGRFSGVRLIVPERSADIYQIEAESSESSRSAAANYSIMGYYPKIQLSSYYIMSNEDLRIFGSGFIPGERVVIFQTSSSGMTPVAVLYANTSGALNGTIPYTPSATLGTVQSYVLQSDSSKANIRFQVVFGKYYPQITPSSYYVAKGQNMTVTGTGFAPGETVQVFINNSEIAETTADNAGDMSLGFTAPPAGQTFTISAQGTLSRSMSSRTVTLMQQ